MGRFKFGDTKTIGLIAVIVIIVGIVLRFCMVKLRNGNWLQNVQRQEI